ncbi:hypothetical protein V6N13_103833 [Hibiscus sabdariffa]|uniref:Uncharacterized protein n=2 Tax=Hibiscus sabdariffa TaxID=183260 RepID=A0ABR2NTC6_9ROSI
MVVRGSRRSIGDGGKGISVFRDPWLCNENNFFIDFLWNGQLPPKVKENFTAKPASLALFRLRLSFIDKGVVELSRLCLKCGSLVTDANQVFTAVTPTLAAFDTTATVSEVRVEPLMGASNDVALGACCFLICFGVGRFGRVVNLIMLQSLSAILMLLGSHVISSVGFSVALCDSKADRLSIISAMNGNVIDVSEFGLMVQTSQPYYNQHPIRNHCFFFQIMINV